MHKVLCAPCKVNVRRRKRRPCHVQPGQQLHNARRSGFCKRRHAGQRRSPAFTPTPSLHTKECTYHAIFICITSFLTPKQIQCTSEGKPCAKSKCSPARERERERERETSATFRSISGFALPSKHHNNSPCLWFPIFETSATALCGTTGKQIQNCLLAIQGV